MNLNEYQAQVGQIRYGKRMPNALYVHRGGLADIGDQLGALLEQLVSRYQISADFNLVKFRTDELKLSFLAYPSFETNPHPVLTKAIAIDLATGKARRTDYSENANPPILHRKELFLPECHPLRAEFDALTRAEEEAGLYENAATIGFKLNWEKLLQSKGLTITGHRLVKRGLPEATSGLLGKPRIQWPGLRRSSQPAAWRRPCSPKPKCSTRPSRNRQPTCAIRGTRSH